MFSWIKTNKNQNTDMKKLEKLSALMNKEAKGITAEEISEVNAELSANGFEVEVSPIGTIYELTEQIAAVTGLKDVAEAELARVTKDLNELKAENASAGDEETTLKKDKDISIATDVNADEALSDNIRAKYGY